MLAPSLVIFGVFVYYPFIKNFQLAFYRQSVAFGNSTREYVGFDQIRDVLGDAEFRDSLWVTVRFVLLTVPAGIALGVLLAALAHQRLRGIGLYRTIFSSTVASSVAVASVIFLTLLNPQIGLINYYLDRQGGESLLQDPTWALPMVALVTIWQSLGITFILMSSALQSIPDELFEASRIDGASALADVPAGHAAACSRRRSSSRSSSARSPRGRRSARSTCSPRADRSGRRTSSRTRSSRRSSSERNEGEAAVQSIALFVIVLRAHADPAAVPRAAGALCPLTRARRDGPASVHRTCASRSSRRRSRRAAPGWRRVVALRPALACSRSSCCCRST